MINILAVVLMILIAWLWYWGGGKNAWLRDIMVPIVVGGFFCCKYNVLVGILTAGACQIIRLGYGAYDPEHDSKPSFLAKITHDRNGWWNRAIAGGIYGIVAPLVIVSYATIFHRTPGWVWFYYGYIILNAVADFSVSRLKLNRLATDLVVGGVFGAILFL